MGRATWMSGGTAAIAKLLLQLSAPGHADGTKIVVVGAGVGALTDQRAARHEVLTPRLVRCLQVRTALGGRTRLVLALSAKQIDDVGLLDSLDALGCHRRVQSDDKLQVTIVAPAGCTTVPQHLVGYAMPTLPRRPSAATPSLSLATPSPSPSQPVCVTTEPVRTSQGCSLTLSEGWYAVGHDVA
jgi:hypothetical protein